MKVMIDVPTKEFGVDIADKFQEFFQRLQAETEHNLISNTNLVCGNYELETIEMFLNAFKEMVIIPEGATNGDMIKVMFPNAIIEINELGSMVHVKYNNHTCWVNYELEWWNTPYKKEAENEQTN
jgi:hypothetical protein